MQQTSTCTSCGAEMTAEARFCRRCGQASTRFKTESVTEGTTRILKTPEQDRVFGQEFYEQHGHLAQPTNPSLAQGNQTARNLTTETKKQNWSMISIALVAGLALVVIVLGFALWNRTAPTVPPTVIIKKGAPPIQPPLPPPQPPRIVQGGTSISHEFYYPGAETVMEVSDPNEGNTAQLRTTDSLERVVKWYTEKLKPTQVVKTNGSNVVLKGSQMTAIINAQGPQTMIMLHEGGGDE
ncbi:MAG TPA: zinc ribbon domain-containing protein [Pyrinomonadaceae bacterium]|nr:zinc ribbon domain-containing protein [Pyrinomonadaceae bacterium]